MLATIIKLPLIHSLSYLITVEKRIVKLCSENITKLLRKKQLTEMKDTIIDFLYRLKDRHPLSTSSIASLFGFLKNESFDVAHRVMNFMLDNNLKPSEALIEEYRQSKTTKTLNLFPSYEDWDKIGMSEERYNKLKKAYRREIIKNKIELIKYS